MKSILGVGAILIMVLCSVPAMAGTINVFYDAGTTQVTTGLTGFATYGDMMDGMMVTAYFASGASESLAWADTGPGSGGVFGTDWSLQESGDTYGGYWTLVSGRNDPITSIFIDAGAGDSLFDTASSPDVFGTPGSYRGWDFQVVTGDFDINATYIDQIALSGNSPVGDIFRYLDIDFVSSTPTFSGTLQFIADTDNLQFAGDLEPIPEPTSLLLLGTGLGVLGLAAYRRRKK